MRLKHRARGAAGRSTVVAASMLLGACDVKQELLAPQQPGVIAPAQRANATAADALYVGALGRWKNAMNGNGSNTEAIWNWEALFTDEFGRRTRSRSATTPTSATCRRTTAC